MHCIERTGSGPAVVCVHGYCQSSAYWLPTLERLASLGIGGIAPDLPGFGKSSQDPGPYTLEAYADGLAALLESRGIGRAVLVGGSMGGAVAQHFALRHPDRVLRLLLVATGPYTADPAAALAKADALATARWDEATIAPIVAGFFFRVPPARELARYRQIALMASQAAAVDAARSNATGRTLERLNAINVPTLIVQGEHDRARTPAHGAEMRDRIPDARLAVLQGVGHTPQLEDPDAFHEAALPFIRAAGSGGRDGI